MPLTLVNKRSIIIQKTIAGLLPVFLGAVLAFFLSGCEYQDVMPQPGPEYYALEYPNSWPEPNIPLDNQLTQSRIALGRKLFFDRSLSRDSTVACGSCHKQRHAFAEPKKVSEGVDGLKNLRNSPTLFNLAWEESFFWDGGSPTLELQAKGPIEAENEMDINLVVLAERLNQDPEYVEMFNEAYRRDPDPFSILRALASFQRTFISKNSPYDQFLEGDRFALSLSQYRGRSLFFSDSLNCSQCHSGPFFTNRQFESNGLTPTARDTGRARITLNPFHSGKFRVPTLRNVEVSGPYMHDGRFETLEEVVDHYAAGGENWRNQSPFVAGFTLNPQQKDDLINFLKSLTDTTFLYNTDYLPAR